MTDSRANFVPLSRLRREAPPQHAPPTLLDERPAGLALRDLKRAALGALRLAAWVRRPEEYAAPTLAPRAPREAVVTERVTVARSDPHAHPAFEHGKRENLRLTAPALDGLRLDAGRTFSMWRALGPLLARRGFVAGMELRGGCVVPALGGGVCLLSNALFRLALRADFVVVERHGHSLEAIAPAEGECWGADATLAFPHIDLRVRPREGEWVLRARLDDALELSLHGDRALTHDVTLRTEGLRTETRDGATWRTGRLVRERVHRVTGARSREVVAVERKRVLAPHELGRNCLTCGETSCHAREDLVARVDPSLR